MEEKVDDMSEVELELFSDYYEERLSSDKKAQLQARFEEDLQYKESYLKFEKTMKALSGMHKMSAPEDFDKKVEETIYRRSGGRFFGKRAFGDRIPYEILALFVMIFAGLIYWLGRNSATGGLRFNEDNTPPVHEGAKDVMPKR